MPSSEFNTGAPLAFFLTWTTYGSWLPGDERGWNRKGELGSLRPSQARHESALAELKETKFVLSKQDRKVVESTIHSHCEIREWKLHAINARSNHAHVVVAAPDYKPETVVAQFKAWCTRRLKQHHPARTRFWTQGASCRWINQEAALAAAIKYTLEAQDKKGVEYDS